MTDPAVKSPAIKRHRKTKETDIELSLRLRGRQEVSVKTGHGFFDHMLHQLAFHAGWDLTLKADGDLWIDDHHLVEDTALTLGGAIQEGWRGLADMNRYGQRLLPMDETLVLCALDLCGRPLCRTNYRFTRESVGNLSTEMVPHFFNSLAMAGAFTLHLRQMDGENHHHIIEASFKALAHAFREAMAPSGRISASTKGML
ncbi:imidazoleglycerol-phosphate dehydratase HisB [Acanthopleuribacter pedis]|uniref:Imidazoleglycerol-phosphate dehydratase n=1 Tax=Acanthopleuribacter pedis TaxID=442870 RepID=A0A8J7QLL6_9BACT|nr:imidazoleglycerol-phosphate dehydratase HisB [Acanthopleuribacter pedis]MBO1320230.1 imidazoleglycerol-phosphate dehydratase HisB [Acanthopleuribacter pedis]